MATTKTRADLVNQALSNLRVLAAGQAPAEEDYKAVDDHVDATFAQLSARDIVTVGDDSQIPIEWFMPLSVLLAQDAAIQFGMPADPNQIVMAEAKLREMTYNRPTGEPVTEDYF